MKKFASFLPDRIKLALLKRQLAQSIGAQGRASPTLAVYVQPDGTGPLRVSLSKLNDEIGVGLDLGAAMERPFVYRMLYARLPAVVRVFSLTGARVRTVAADLSDGDDQLPGGLAFCSSRPDVILVPDPVFVNSNGYATFRRKSTALPWSQRRGTVLWRGSTTGFGALTTESMRADDPGLRQRVRMCLMLRATPDTDVKIRKTEGNASPDDRGALVRHGLIGGKIRQSDWGRYKFALDVDGHTNAWSNFFIRLLLGCCVLKIQSERGYRQWYYDRLKPWRHYVPVRADMSDLIEMIDWCRSHDAECAQIASAGHAFAHATSVEGEIDDAVRRLETAKADDFAVVAGAP